MDSYAGRRINSTQVGSAYNSHAWQPPQHSDIYIRNAAAPLFVRAGRTHKEHCVIEWWNWKVFWQLFGESFAALATQTRADFHSLAAASPHTFRHPNISGRTSADFLCRRTTNYVSSAYFYHKLQCIFWSDRYRQQTKSYAWVCATSEMRQVNNARIVIRLIADDRLVLIFEYLANIRWKYSRA